MRLNQVWIQHYGPLQKDLELSEDINVVQGPNESGKSLLVEALLKKLVDGSVPNPRIDETPEGFIELYIDGEGTRKLEDGESLTSFYQEEYNGELRAEEIRNVFVVRNGDLSFHETDDFYTHITDKLTGRRVEDINEVKSALFDAGRITESRKDISSDDRYDSAGEHHEKAKKLKKEVKEYTEKAKKEGLDYAETEFYTAQQEEQKLESKLADLEDAKEAQEKQAKHTELEDDKDSIKDNLEALDELPDGSDLEDIDRRLQELSEKEGEESELKDRKERSSSLAKWSIAAGVTMFAVSLGLGSPLAGVVAAIAFLAAGFYFYNKINSLSQKIAEVDVEEQNIVSDARSAGLSIESRDEIRGKISEIQDKRDKLEKDNQGNQRVLEREFGFEAESMQDAVDKAEENLEELENSIDDSIEIEYTEQIYKETEKKYKQAKKKRERLEQEIRDHKDKLNEFQKRAHQIDFNTFVGGHLDLEIENLDALDRLVDRLEELISTIEEDAEASRVAIEIFDEIQDEEQKETAALFEEGSRATEIFREITDGRYTKVTYDNEDNKLIVEKSTGETFVPEELSDGTRDQLYLSIRVALGEQILEGQPGFFIMDDAFLTSDASRLEIEADIVEELANQGWQIIYLSAKNDAIKELSDRTDNGVKELRPLE